MLPEHVKIILDRNNEAKARRSPWVTVWRDLSRYVNPIKDNIGTGIGSLSTPDLARHSLHDTTAQEALMVYASGCMEWLTPADKPWFRLEPPKRLAESEPVKQWLADATEEMQGEMQESNFFSEIHEAYLDDGAFGTTALNCEEEGGALLYENFEVGDFAVLENHRKKVDTIFRELDLTIRQAEQKFGRENLSEEMQKALEENDRGMDQEQTFLHCVYPRENRQPGRIDGANMPYASVYIDCKAKKVVRESGYWEMPTSIARHLKWGKSPYGFAPSWNALADARQVNNLQMNLDVLAEVAAFPRIKSNPNLEGEIDLRKGGVTYVNEGETLEEWATQGNYAIGKDRVEERQRAIDRAFHVDLFNTFRMIPPGKEMTALEVQARLEDKLTLFSPTFARKIDELLDPIIKRTFNIMLRGGAFGQPPEEMIEFLGDGVMDISDPQIRYSSRLALATERIHNSGLSATLQTFAQLFEFRPELLDNFDLDTAVRDSAQNNGMTIDWQRDVAERDELREQREEEQARLAAEEQAMQMAAAG